MAQDWARAFYASGAWVRCRESFAAMRRAKDGGVCQDCGRSLGEIAHHWPVPLTPENIGDPAVALNHDNLRWVCKACHDLYPGHGVAKPEALLLAFDANGDVIGAAGDAVPPIRRPARATL